MAEGRPRLVAVAEPPDGPAAAERRAGRRLTWFLAALALLCAAGWGLARRESSQLAGELAAAQTELSRAQASLQAIEAQRAEVRSQLEALATDASALSERLTGLEALLATDPVRAADAQPMRSEEDLED
jgi:septal ring factor EnvC (AmiA/AmiB activator)